MEIKKGDLVTIKYLNGDFKTVKSVCKSDNFELELKGLDPEYQVLKVERPIQYETIYNMDILDNIEKEYLQNLLRPFKNKIMFIAKRDYYEKQFIQIQMLNDELIDLPLFDKDKMYIGMHSNTEYTIEELSLILTY